jgi:uncharacterized protein
LTMRSVEVTFPAGSAPIDGYAADGFRVGGRVFRGPTAILPDKVLNWAGLHDFSTFLAERAAFDVLLVGMGRSLVQPGAALAAERAQLEAAGVGVELMTTPSACRTYNVLLAEGRRVAAALVPV